MSTEGNKVPIRVRVNEWHHQCADGCCNRYGVEVFVNGEGIGSRECGDTTDVLEMVLQHLGYDAEVSSTVTGATDYSYIP